MIIQVQPKYRVRLYLVWCHKHRLSKSLLKWYYFSFYWFNLKSFSISAQTILTSTLQHEGFTICVLYSALRAVTFIISHYPLYVEVTFSQCNRVINGNKETAKMTGMQTGTLASVLLWEMTPWQSTLIFMKEFFWINEKPLCSLSEVFLIIWTLFSLHATLYQKFIKTFFLLSFSLTRACPLIFSSACLHLPSQTSIKVIRALQTLCMITSDNRRKERNSGRPHKYSSHTHQIFMSGCSSELMRLTIQLKRRPYKAFDMASRTSTALSTVFVRMMVSPLVTTHWEVSASWNSSGPMLRRDAAGKKGERVNQFDNQGLISSDHQHKNKPQHYFSVGVFPSVHNYV